MPRAKKPVQILPDGKNIAIRAAAMIDLQPKNAGAFVLMPDQAKGTAAGVRSLIAERDKLRAMVKEAYQAGLSQCCGNDDPGEVNWTASPFPEKIERPWDA
jgi:hypothetical protein